MGDEQFAQEHDRRMDDTRGTGCYGDCAELTTLRSQLAEAKADNARLREALEWYEARVAYLRRIGTVKQESSSRIALAEDGGRRAREALADTPEATQ